MKRESGYYWVKGDEKDPSWNMMYWDATEAKWLYNELMNDWGDGEPESFYKVIDEDRIKNPDEQAGKNYDDIEAAEGFI